MAKIRVHQLAKQLGVDARTLIKALNEMGEPVKSASATLVQPVVRKLIEHPDVGARRSQTLETIPGGTRPEPSGRVDEVSRARSTASISIEQPSLPETLVYASKSPGGRKDPSLAEVRRRVNKAASRVAGAAARTAQLEHLIQLGAHSPLSRMDAATTRNQLVREMQKVRSLRPKVPLAEEELRAQLIELRRGARELEDRLNQLTFSTLPELRPSLARAALDHGREAASRPQSSSAQKTSPTRPKREPLPPELLDRVANLEEREQMGRRLLCRALTEYLGFDVIRSVEAALEQDGTPREVATWLKTKGAPKDLSRVDVIRIAEEARRLRSLQRKLDLRKRRIEAKKQAAARSVARQATRSHWTSRLSGSSNPYVRQVSGGLPTLGRRR